MGLRGVKAYDCQVAIELSMQPGNFFLESVGYNLFYADGGLIGKFGKIRWGSPFQPFRSPDFLMAKKYENYSFENLNDLEMGL